MNNHTYKNETFLINTNHIHFNSSHIHIYKSLPSTMDIARQKAQSNCPNHTIIIADHQTSGRGRLQRQWDSDPGGLYMSWIVRPTLDISCCFAYTFSAALSIVRSLKKNFSVISHVKWPNDVLVDGYKIAGILTETLIDNHQLTYLIIGMGININNDPDSTIFKATSIKKLMQKQVNRISYINYLLNELYDQFENISSKETLASWKKNNCTLGKTVQIVTPTSTICGRAIDINANGNLLVETDHQTIETIYYGDCFQDN